MKKYLLIFLSIFSLFFITDTVNAASELYDYMFTTAEVKAGDNSYFTGSRNPGLTTGVISNYSSFSFGYYNLSNTFQPGQKYRITADYCTNNNNYIRYDVVGKSGVSSFDLSYKKGSTCAYTIPDGTVFVGDLISFTFDFVIDSTDYTTGFVKFNFFFDSTYWHWLGFKDYRIYPSSEITDIDNTQNIIDNSNKNQQETNDRLDNINGSLNDDSAPDTSNAFSDIKLNTNSAISNLVLMPINYLNRVLNLSKNTCTTYSLDFGIFNSDYKLNLPCIKLENFFGAQWWNVIDYLICFYMIYNIIMLAISAFEDITSLRDSYDSLYQPKHADTGYKPKHGGD